MKKHYLSGITMVMLFFCFLFSTRTQADVYKRVILQSFWWDYWNSNYPNSYANYLTELAPRLKELDINAVWIPPSVKNTGTNSVGYSPFDHYDLGDKYQKGANTTRFGTKDELLRMIAVMHANGIEVIQDIVLNHVDGAGSEVDGNGGSDPEAWDGTWKNFRYVSYATPIGDGSENDYWNRSGRWSKNWKNFHANPGHICNDGNICSSWWGPDFCYYEGAYGESSNVVGYNPTQSPNYMRNEARNWIMWLKKQTAIDGFRWDAVKHFPVWAQQDFSYNVKYNLPDWCKGGETMLNAGEYVGSKDEMDNYCSSVQYANGGREFMMGTFDFSLRSGIKSIIDGGGYGDIGSMPGTQQNLRYCNYTNDKVHRSVNFVNSHDTFRPTFDDNGNYNGWDTSNETGGHIDPFNSRLGTAYATIMALDGNPCVFMEDLFNLSDNNRYTHDPKDPAQLPVREKIKNLIWCHQNLDFKYGDYKVRWQSADLLVIERSGKAIIAITDNGSTDQEEWIDTDFRNASLKDYSGGTSGTRTAYSDGRFLVKVTNTGTGLGYAIWGPETVAGTYEPYRDKSTTQEWEMADDLGDSHCESLGQGGALPTTTNQRICGKIYVEKDKTVSFYLHPAKEGYDITIALYDLYGNLVTKKNGTADITDEWVATHTGWVTIKIWNTVSNNIAQKCWVRATYYAPATVTNVNTDTSDTRVSIWTANAGTSDWNDCKNWEQGKIPLSGATVVIPDNAPFPPIVSSDVTLAKLVIEKGKGSCSSPDIAVIGSLTVSDVQSLSGETYICGNGSISLGTQTGSFGNCEGTNINEFLFRKEIQVFPNPVTHNCKVTFYASQKGIAIIEIFDALGRKVISQEQLIDDLGENSTLLSMEKISKGTYFCKIKMPNTIGTISLIKK